MRRLMSFTFIKLKDTFDILLAREGRTEIAQACFDFLPTRAQT